MNKHVVSLKIARKLKEAGWENKTEFWWVIYDKKWFLAHKNEGIADTNNQIVAPLATEILDELPDVTISRLYVEPDYEKWKKFDSKCAHWNGKFKKKYWQVVIRDGKMKKDLVSLSDALAKMWLYLKENDII